MDVKTIRDFLPKQNFDRLSQIIFAPTFSWYLTTSVASPYLKSKENSKLFYMSHLVYEKEKYVKVNLNDQAIIDLLLEKLAPEEGNLQLIRMKINFYPNTTELHEHDYHRDYEYSHMGAILSLNTCDGYTKIRETDTKYYSWANTLLSFNPSEDHCSTTTTNAIGRFNININYQ
tara:strand:+ start:95 stop:616 length:522 start_codon:yes stop_codon:yes gene_type:complete